MAGPALLQALQRELAIEKAARQELEKQTVLKTRQLWHLREQQDKETKQYQEQLSVLRASLILAHKQQHQHSDPYDSIQHPSPDPKQHPAAAQDRLQEDASPTKADQHKAARQRFTPDSPQKLRGSPQHQQQLPAVASPSQHDTPAAGADAAAALNSESKSTPADQAGAAATTPARQGDSNGTTAASIHAQQQQQPDASETAEQLLAAASKVQQLVEQLSATEPSAAADLSVLQWQLTAIYGSLTRSCAEAISSGSSSAAGGSVDISSSLDNQHSSRAVTGRQQGVLQGVACTGSDPLSSSGSPAAEKGSKQDRSRGVVLVDAAIGTSPMRDIPAAAAAAACQGTQQQQQVVLQQQQEQDWQAASRTAAAAQLFSGAANSRGSGSKLVAASLQWWYLEPGDPPIVKGPYDAGLMLRWFLKGFLDNALRIAGVVQTSSSSSGRTPPESVSDFLPLGQLLQQVQQGSGYTPAAPGKEQQQLPSPARRPNSASRLSKQHQGQLSRSSSGAGNVGAGYEGAVGGAGSLEGGGLPGDGLLAKGGSILSETVGYWLDMAASAQLPGSLSLVEILDKVIGNVAPQSKP